MIKVIGVMDALAPVEMTMRRPRRNHSVQFKARVALAALRGDKTRVELSEQFAVHAKIGQLTLAVDFLARAMIDRTHRLSVVCQCQLLALPRATIPQPGNKVYPYLLRGLVIERPDQVGCAGVTYIPMARGFMYLVAVMDWSSRRVLAWRRSNTMTADFCVTALADALARCGPPASFNTDQGSQFTSAAFTDTRKAAGVAISMDGKGRWLDNVFIERLWRTLKYEEIHLRAYETVTEARTGIGRYLDFYHRGRTHQALERRTPDEVYFQSNGPRKAA